MVTPKLFDPDEADEQAVRDMATAAFGSMASAWLVNRFRKTIHRNGAFLVQVDIGTEVKPWFSYAVRYLRHRQGWSVMVQRHRGHVAYKFVWLAWSSFTRVKAIPDALRPWS